MVDRSEYRQKVCIFNEILVSSKGAMLYLPDLVNHLLTDS